MYVRRVQQGHVVTGLGQRNDWWPAPRLNLLAGVTKPGHLADAVAALDVQLTGEEVTALEEHYTPRKPTYYGTPSGY